MSMQPIATAPKDRPILAWCTSPSPEVYGTEGEQIFSNHTFHFAPVKKGWNVIEWTLGSEGDDKEPDWWFLSDDVNETPAWPVLWMELPTQHAVEVALLDVPREAAGGLTECDMGDSYE